MKTPNDTKSKYDTRLIQFREPCHNRETISLHLRLLVSGSRGLPYTLYIERLLKVISMFSVSRLFGWIALLAMAMPTIVLGAAPLPPRVCVDPADCEADDSGPVENYIKWNPGHYMISDNGATTSRRLQYLDEIANEPVIRGMQVRYFWAQLEPQPGVYKFDELDQLLAKAKTLNKQIAVEVWTRSFNSTRRPSPAYIQTNEYGGGDYVTYADPDRSGFGSRLWNPKLMDRLIALHTALGKRYNSHPNFETISTGETALGPGALEIPEYSHEGATAQYERLIIAMRRAWPNTNVRLATNFWHSQSHFVRLHEGALVHQYALGGPDPLIRQPANQTSGSQRIIVGEVGGHEYRGVVPIMFNAESELGWNHASVIYAKANDDLRVTHLAWLRNNWVANDEYKWDTGILPFIKSIDGRLSNTACPSLLAGRCRATK